MVVASDLLGNALGLLLALLFIGAVVGRSVNKKK